MGFREKERRMKMNKHQLLDRLTCRVGAVAAGQKKFFAKSIGKEAFKEVILSIQMDLPEIQGEGEYKVMGRTDKKEITGDFMVYQWLGKDYPTLIYHHGNNEQPFNFGKTAKNTFRDIIKNRKDQLQANVILLRAPFHDQGLKAYTEKLTEGENFITMLAFSAVMADRLVKVLKEKTQKPVAVAGFSLGGWVTNLHKTYFDTADAYIPMAAGALLGELFITSPYRALAGEPALEDPKELRRTMNFQEDFLMKSQDNIYPLLGEYDQIIEYPVQSASYPDCLINKVEKGHVTAATDGELLFNHIQKSLQQMESQKQVS